MAEPGEMVADRYRLLTMIGSGSTGRVWSARDEVLQRDVALKEIVAPVRMPDAEKARLHVDAVREARLAARLSHRHVVAVFDVLCEADSPWIVMEYMWSLGATLYAAVEGRPPYPRDSAPETSAALAGTDPDPMVLAGPLRPVISGLLRRDPDDRATAADTQRMLRAATRTGTAFRRSPAPSPVPGAWRRIVTASFTATR